MKLHLMTYGVAYALGAMTVVIVGYRQSSAPVCQLPMCQIPFEFSNPEPKIESDDNPIFNLSKATPFESTMGQCIAQIGLNMGQESERKLLFPERFDASENSEFGFSLGGLFSWSGLRFAIDEFSRHSSAHFQLDSNELNGLHMYDQPHYDTTLINDVTP